MCLPQNWPTGTGRVDRFADGHQSRELLFALKMDAEACEPDHVDLGVLLCESKRRLSIHLGSGLSGWELALNGWGDVCGAGNSI